VWRQTLGLSQGRCDYEPSTKTTRSVNNAWLEFVLKRIIVIQRPKVIVGRVSELGDPTRQLHAVKLRQIASSVAVGTI
jgi:hypothetical protein